MNQLKKVIGSRDYWSVNIHYGEYQGKRRYLIEKDINAEAEYVKSMFDGIKWFNEFVDENERDLAFADGSIDWLSVAIVEDEDGDQEEDWNDVQSSHVVSLHWDRSDLDDDTVEEGDEYEDEDEN